MKFFNTCLTILLLGSVGCNTPAPHTDSSTKGETTPTADARPTPRPFQLTGSQVVTDTFDIRHDLRDGRLTIALDTDLGDAAKLMVSVARMYRNRGSDEQYPIDYFSEQSTVGAWREPRIVILDHEKWKREIEQRQKVLAAAGEPFTVSMIADDIEISFVVPINQEPPFEALNANLIGKAVTQSYNLRIVRRETLVYYPIDTKNIGRTRFADPMGLTQGNTYRASGTLPIVPEIDPADPIAAIASIRRLSPGEEFTVLEMKRHDNTPWYHVRTRLGEGWVNSVALLGQELVVVRPHEASLASATATGPPPSSTSGPPPVPADPTQNFLKSSYVLCEAGGQLRWFIKARTIDELSRPHPTPWKMKVYLNGSPFSESEASKALAQGWCALTDLYSTETVTVLEDCNHILPLPNGGCRKVRVDSKEWYTFADAVAVP